MEGAVFEMSNVLIIVFAGMAAVFDIRTRRIPNELILGMLGAWVFILAYEILASADIALLKLLDCVLGFLIGAGVFLTVYFISRRSLGGGDVKFMAVAGLYLGLGSTIPAILYGTILATLTGLALILLKRITRKDKMPLAPFLFAGIAITILWK